MYNQTANKSNSKKECSKIFISLLFRNHILNILKNSSGEKFNKSNKILRRLQNVKEDSSFSEIYQPIFDRHPDDVSQKKLIFKFYKNHQFLTHGESYMYYINMIT